MQVDFTAPEAEEFFRFAGGEYDIARVVDPVARKVLRVYAGGREESPSCGAVWGRCSRCDNCTSLQAFRTRGRACKMEVSEERTYWVTSRYIQVDGQPAVAELISDVTDCLMLDNGHLDEISALVRTYQHKLIVDSLTGAYNRRFLDESLLPVLQCRPAGEHINLAIMDLDNFKSVNDTYGHQAGDILLRDVSGFWRSLFSSRKQGAERLVIRFGGDEFLIIACGMELHDFRSEVIRNYGQMRRICYLAPGVAVPFSITFGIAAAEELPGPFDWEALFSLADRRLYAGKRNPDRAETT